MRKSFSFDPPGDGNLFIHFDNGGELFFDDLDDLLELLVVLKKILDEIDHMGEVDYEKHDISGTYSLKVLLVNYHSRYDYNDYSAYVFSISFGSNGVAFEWSPKGLLELRAFIIDANEQVHILKNSQHAKLRIS